MKILVWGSLFVALMTQAHGTASESCDVCRLIKSFVVRAVGENKKDIPWLNDDTNVGNSSVTSAIDSLKIAITREKFSDEKLMSLWQHMSPEEKNFVLLNVFFNVTIDESKPTEQQQHDSVQTFQIMPDDAGVDEVYADMKKKCESNEGGSTTTADTTANDVKKYCAAMKLYELIKLIRGEVRYARGPGEHGHPHHCGPHGGPHHLHGPGPHHHHGGHHPYRNKPEGSNHMRFSSEFWQQRHQEWQQMQARKCEHHKAVNFHFLAKYLGELPKFAERGPHHRRW
ncbi:MAG: hypothetical protein LBF56_00300 [Holosporales bacterium]|nr:hypothetical protein [Holosporales bacterium]